MNYLTLFLKIVAGLAIASVFCISAVTLIGMVGQADCVARAVNGGACPADSFSLVNFHVSAYARLAQAILFLFIFFALFVFSSRQAQELFFVVRKYIVHAHVSYFPFLRWVALHEMSPTSHL
ncbi:MAG: hypothetical protein WCV80_00140 [Candidatus Paceibacterota bacterium]|jgi:hypothetical protein